jgi:hypothetical protein
MLKIKKWTNRIFLSESTELEGNPPSSKRGRPRGRAKFRPERRYLVPKIKYRHGVTITEDEVA